MNNIFTVFTIIALTLSFAGCSETKKDLEAESVKDTEKGLAALAISDYKKAEEFFRAATVNCATNFDARINLAVSLLQLGEMDAANTAITNAISLNPESVEARLLEGQIAYQMRNYTRASKNFIAIAKEKSLDKTFRSTALSSLAIVQLAQNEFIPARISLFRAIRFNPKNAAAWYHLGIMSRDTYKLPDAALEQFEMASRLSDPKDERTIKIIREIIPSLRNAIVRNAAQIPGAAGRKPEEAAKLLAEGEAAKKKKHFKTALKKFEAAYKADPMSFEAAIAYAKSLETQDKSAAGIDKVIAAYRAAIDQKPFSQATYIDAGKYAYSNKRYLTTTEIMNRALAHVYNNKQILDLLIASLQKAGRQKDAKIWKEYRSEL